MEKEIANKNLDINLKISKALSNMKQKGIKTIAYENGKPYIQEPAKTILQMEVEKILCIYKAEFIQVLDKDKKEQLSNIAISTYESKELDAHGHYGGIEFSSGTQKYLKSLAQESHFPMKYSVTKDGAVRYNEEGKLVEQFDLKLIGNKGEKHLLTPEEQIENNLDIQDYLIYASIKDIEDIDFFLDVTPHELMHVFGFKGGIFEGVTENLTRQVASKYNLRAVPFAHKDETILFQKLEKILGKDIIIENTFVKNKEDEEKYAKLSNIIDENLDLKEDDCGQFKKVCDLEKELFTAYKSQNDKENLEKIWQERKESTILLNKTIDNYMQEYPEKLHQLGEDNLKLTVKQQEAKQNKYNKILSIQDKEVEKLNNIIIALEKEPIKNTTKNHFMSSLKSQVVDSPSNQDEEDKGHNLAVSKKQKSKEDLII